MIGTEADALAELQALVAEINSALPEACVQTVNDMVPLYYHAMDAKPLFDDYVAGIASR